MIYDQIQAGAGIKDDHMVPLGLNKGVVGPAIMMEPYLKRVNGNVLACLYSGDGFYKENKDERLRNPYKTEKADAKDQLIARAEQDIYLLKAEEHESSSRNR